MTWTLSIHSLLDAHVEARWTALWATSPIRTPYASWPFLEALSLDPALQLEVVFVSSERTDVAGVVLFKRKRVFFEETYLPFSVQFSPFLYRQPPDEAEMHQGTSYLDFLLTQLEERHGILRLHLPPQVTDVRVGSWHGWQLTPLFTYQISLIDPDGITSKYSTSVRRRLKKEAHGYQLAETPEAYQQAVQHCEESYTRQGRSVPFASSVLQKRIEHLVNLGAVRIFSAISGSDSTSQAAIAVLLDETSAYYWIVGSVPGPSMTVLLDFTLRQLQDHGIEVFDLVGANTPSIAEFKRRFGPILVPYYRLEKITRPSLRLMVFFKRLISSSG